VDDAPIYSCPTRRRGALVGIFAVCAVGCAVVIPLAKWSTFGGALTAATAITGVVLFGGLAFVLHAFVPTRIEVRDARVRLIAPRTETNYEPASVGLRREGGSTYAFIRRTTGRVLARFDPPDRVAAEAAFERAGVSVVS
jgi:hypothetical protein